jgi:hypothetical protein
MRIEYLFAGIVYLIGISPYVLGLIQWLKPELLEVKLFDSKAWGLPDGFFGYIILALFSGLITWWATKMGVTEAFHMQENSKEKDRVRAKVNLINQLIDELNMALREVTEIANGRRTSLTNDFPAFQSTIDAQVQFFIATGPAFMKMIHGSYEKLRAQIVTIPKERAQDQDVRNGTELHPNLRANAEVVVSLLNELIFMLRNEMNDREIRIYRELEIEDRKIREEEKLRLI